MSRELQRSSSWAGKIVLVAVAVLATNLHASGAPERALSEGGWSLGAGVVLGLGIIAIVLARLFGRSIGLIHSDRAALFAMLFMIAIKVVIARVLVFA